MLAIVVFQVLMIGVFGLKENAIVSALSVPPLVFTIIFKIVIMLYFEPAASFMELDNQKDEDKSGKAEEEGPEEADEEFLQVKSIKQAVTRKIWQMYQYSFPLLPFKQLYG